MTERLVPLQFGPGASLGVLTMPAVARRIGVLIHVGGPQYRVGSHRQFVLLARCLAARGYPVMRFDRSGMGDADGAAQPFFDVSDQLEQAIEQFAQAAALERVVLWGLCDAVSAIAVHAHWRTQQATPSRTPIAGYALVNPWVHSPQGEAKTQLKHYYAKKLMSPQFWVSLLKGGVDLGQSVKDLASVAKKLVARRDRQGSGAAVSVNVTNFVSVMRLGLERSAAPVSFFLSGEDLVAREFEALVASDPAWQALVAKADVHRFEHANHTFASQALRAKLEQATCSFLEKVDRS